MTTIETDGSRARSSASISKPSRSGNFRSSRMSSRSTCCLASWMASHPSDASKMAASPCEPLFTEAVAKKVYYGPVDFRRESEPYMTLSMAGTGSDTGVSVAEVNLKLIWDVVSQIKVG